MPSEVDEFTQKLLERTMARREAMQQKMIDQQGGQGRKRRPLEPNENIEIINQDEDKVPQTSQSPNKRSRMEGNNENKASLKTGESTKVSDRMKRILDQRKLWEAADQGLEVDYTNVASPVRHESGESPTMEETRRVDTGRKARLAALAEKVNNYEDDYSHHVIEPSPEVERKVWKPPQGRKTPMSDSYTSAVLNPPSTTANEEPAEQKRTKQLSNRVSLSIETLSQFASSNRPTKRTETPVKSKKLADDKITLSHSNNNAESHQVTPTSKSLQQRLIELQKNGCQAEQSSVDKTMIERQRELDLLNKDSEVESDTTTEASEYMGGNSPEPNDDQTIDENENDDDLTFEESNDMMEQQVNDSDYEESINEALDAVGGGEDEDGGSPMGGAAVDESYQEDGGPDDEGLEEERSEIVADDEKFNDEADNVEYEDEENEEETEEIDLEIEEVEEAGDEDMIDDLFDGVEFEESRSPSPFAPTLTRQKSKLEIKCELSVRKQTCNEAEDTHMVTRQPSRRPLARSTSSESVVSLGAEKKATPFPISIDSYRTEKRKSLRKQSDNKKVVRNESVQSVAPPRAATVKEKIGGMMEEIQQQQRVIQQASAALNCCYDAHHGKGSITELEAEKLLLIASEKRLALLAEVQALKSRSVTEPPQTVQPCLGNLTIRNLRLPLRTEYIFSMASKKDCGDIRSHYYFLLVRCGPTRILASHLASTHDSLSGDSLVFSDEFKLVDLESNFDITIEVYSVTHRSRADGVPNQEKSKRKLSGILHKSLTPRKLRSRSHMTMTHTSSPGGPNAIRISSFSLIGAVSINLNDVKSEKFTLQKVPFLSPISGHFACKIEADFQSNVEQRGFLTMFDDVGGLGAWHRRWCALIRGVLFSWTYPDDEKYKEALCKIDLTSCISERIRTVERIMCARPNTFELRTMRPRRHGDKDNLITQDTGSVITTKHWLAADTKDERIAWIESMNQALADVRAWDTNALKPLK